MASEIPNNVRIRVSITGSEPEIFEGNFNAMPQASGALEIIDFDTYNRVTYAAGTWSRCEVQVLTR